MTFQQYTDSFEANSQVVESAYYNAHDKTLAVVLNSGDTYEYSAVPTRTWSDFKYSSSKGRFYNTTIKRQYGPGEYLGYSADEDFEEYSVPAPSMSAVTNEAHGSSSLSVSGYTPKNLTYAEGAVINGPLTVVGSTNVNPDTRFDLAAPENDRVTYKTDVVFTVENGNSEKTYTVEAGSNIQEATGALDEVAQMLGVAVSVKRVTVHFE